MAQNPYGVSSLLKEGTRHYSGVNEATLRNIQACKALSETTRTSLGPNGMNKLIIDQKDKLFVTSDAATILKEMDIIHPAAKMLVLAAERQEHEFGDGTNLVVTFCGELLQQAESLLGAGLHCSEIISGYSKAGAKALEELETLATHQPSNTRDVAEVSRFLKSTIDAKQYSFSSLLTPIIAQACIDVCPSDGSKFNTDSIRTVKILGGGVADTKLVCGFAMLAGAEGTIRHVQDAKIGVFVSGIDIPHTEVKGTLRFRHGEELENFARSEEQELEQMIIQIKASGCNVVVSGQSVGELAMHFLERYGLMVVKVQSKFQLRRLCQATKARPLVRLGAPTPEEIGHASSVSIDEVGSLPLCTIAVDHADEAEISTIIIRGSSTNICDDVERCIDDGVHAYRAMALDPRFVAGAGSTEIELAHRLHRLGESTPGLDQYAIKKYAEALEVVPRILAENSSMKSINTISSLYAAHTAGHVSVGINVDDSVICDALDRQVFDSFAIKANALRLATETVVTILNVDQIIMSKPAGGPKIPEMGGARDSLAPFS